MSVAPEVSQPTDYQILQLPQNDQSIDPITLKAAYRRALLVHHPDKKTSSSEISSSVAKQPNHAYSVDQITKAYKTLSSVSERAEYTRQLEDDTKRLNTGIKEAYHAGVETFDLEELIYNDDTAIWSRKCRCGEERGYTLVESDLEREREHGEIYIACKGCSLSIRVLYEVAPAGEDVEDAS
jgi:curved DNA-binding protein CbpA